MLNIHLPWHAIYMKLENWKLKTVNVCSSGLNWFGWLWTGLVLSNNKTRTLKLHAHTHKFYDIFYVHIHLYTTYTNNQLHGEDHTHWYQIQLFASIKLILTHLQVVFVFCFFFNRSYRTRIYWARTLRWNKNAWNSILDLNQKYFLSVVGVLIQDDWFSS